MTMTDMASGASIHHPRSPVATPSGAGPCSIRARWPARPTKPMPASINAAEVATGERGWWMLAPLAVSVAAMVALGLLLPDTVARLIGRIAEAITT